MIFLVESKFDVRFHRIPQELQNILGLKLIFQRIWIYSEWIDLLAY